MGTEIEFLDATGKTCYVVFINTQGEWLNSGLFETFNAANWANYAFSASEFGTSGVYHVSVNALNGSPSDVYSMVAFRQIGGAAAITDLKVSYGDVQWSGTAIRTLTDVVLSAGVKHGGTDTWLELDDTNGLFTGSPFSVHSSLSPACLMQGTSGLLIDGTTGEGIVVTATNNALNLSAVNGAALRMASSNALGSGVVTINASSSLMYGIEIRGVDFPNIHFSLSAPIGGSAINYSVGGGTPGPFIFDRNVDYTARIATGVWNFIIESTMTAVGMMRVFAGFLMNKAIGGGTANVRFRDMADSKDRLAFTTDANGNRTAVSNDPT